MPARRLGWALLALLVGAAVGVGAAYATRPVPDATGTPEPVPADQPPAPTEDPYAPDIDYPPLGEIVQFDTYRIGNAIQSWQYVVPAGWVAYAVPGEVLTAPEEVRFATEIRFRPRVRANGRGVQPEGQGDRQPQDARRRGPRQVGRRGASLRRRGRPVEPD